MKVFLIIMAVVFAVATVILYNSSVNKLDRDTARITGVSSTINIQATVFCAATAIMCVINIVGALVISALEMEFLSSMARTREAVKSMNTQEGSKSKEEQILSQGGWRCSECGKVNYSYMTTCSCGKSKNS